MTSAGDNLQLANKMDSGSKVDFKAKVAIVTGASSGIGEAVALDLARRGVTVAAVARRAERLRMTVERCQRSSPGSFAVVADVSVRADSDRVIAEVLQRSGQVDILVNNAGIALHRHVIETAVEDVERVIQTNYLGAVYMTSGVLHSMIERHLGSIVNITSVAGHLPLPQEAAYCASKAALSAWTQSIAIDLAGTGVHIGELSPGPIGTEIWQKASVDYGRRLYPPQVVAAAVVRMLEEHRTYMTVPRRFGAPGAIYPLLGRPMRWGIRSFAEAGMPKTISESRSAIMRRH